MGTRREGMLRLEFQEWYPSIEAGRWYPADELTDLVIDHHRHGSPQWRPLGRVPSDRHFLFRHGSQRPGTDRQRRHSDRSSRHSEPWSNSPQLDF